MEQTVKHSFWECNEIQAIYRHVKLLLKTEVKLNFENVFICQVTSPINHIANYLILQTKMYVFNCKCRAVKPDINEFIRKIMQLKRAEEFNACKMGTIKKFTKRWSMVKIDCP